MQLDLEDIMRALPHRPPIVLLDRVSLLEPAVRIVASKTVHAAEPWFNGHFPGHPVFPAVLIVEALAQAGAVLAAHSPGTHLQESFPYLVKIEEACIRKPVYPGHRLELHVRRCRAWGRYWRLAGEARVDDQVVASARLLAALVPKSAALGQTAQPSRSGPPR